MVSTTVQSLQQRITQMQPTRLPERNLPTHPGLGPVLPGGAIHAGSSYSVRGSWQLALAFLTEASSAGAWCGVIGCPSFGAEAAAAMGVALDRCILIPSPGAHGFALAGALSEILTVTLLHAPAQVPAGVAERIAARLREHQSALVVTGDWPNTAATLEVTASRWEGLEHGFGRLRARTLGVATRSTRGTAHHTLRFADGALATAPPTRVRP
ncbi:hypothetical protein JOF28_000726 [Leucobacter exalbidus]|uniref:Uncharacterized protein n=1 Tax=Leucobacter exalbidus TaxID=662960 RepID=A0A940PUF6_9MICO|nr:hypothetical protein [Leucobacter exalbidus]MBP1325494.1 hypothetical protein [Leucobacter exalbidus]